MICVNIAPSFLYRIHRTPRGDEERREGGSWKNEFLYALSFLSLSSSLFTGGPSYTCIIHFCSVLRSQVFFFFCACALPSGDLH